LGIALAGVFFVTTLMLGSLATSLVVTMLLVVIDIEVLGSIALSGDYFNMVTGLNLVLAVGLSIDAVAHIAHAFLVHVGTGDERAKSALTQIGRSVFNGTISTIVVLLPLVWAETYVFKVFFRGFVAIVGYSAFNGLVILPVILSIIQPSSYSTIRHNLDREAQKSCHSEAKIGDSQLQTVISNPTMVSYV
jgi:Niemann-Pick C1 protein